MRTVVVFEQDLVKCSECDFRECVMNRNVKADTYSLEQTKTD